MSKSIYLYFFPIFCRRRRQEKLRREVRIAMIASMIIGIWMLAWTPYAIVALLGISGQAHLISPLVSAIPALFCKSASCVDPFIYAISHPKFKRELRDRFNWACLFPNRPHRGSRKSKSYRTHDKTLETNSDDTESQCASVNYSISTHNRTEYSSPNQTLRSLNRTNKSSSQYHHGTGVHGLSVEETSLREISGPLSYHQESGHIGKQKIQNSCQLFISNESRM